MKSSVTISLVPEVKGGPFVFWDDLAGSIRSAAALGFDAVEIFPPDPGAIDVKQIGALLNEHRIGLAAIGTGAGWVIRKLTLTSGDAAIRQQAAGFIGDVIDAAGALGGPAIIGSMQGRWGDGVSRDTALTYLRDSLNRLGERAKRWQVPVLYEPLNRYETNLLNTLDATVEFLKTLATDNVKILADLFHMNIEEVDLAAAIRSSRGLIGHVHFVDSNRRAAGMGHLDYQPIAESLHSIGYTGYLSAEAMAIPDSLAAAKQTIDTFRRIFANRT